MATSKKNAKGNKTAHVLNLLTAPGAPKEGTPAAEETAPAEGFAEQPAAAPSRPLLPPILEVAQSNDDNLAQQIQQALEEELEASVPPPSVNQPIPSSVEEVPPVAESILETTPAPSGGKMSQEEIEKLLSATTSAPEPEPAPPVSSGGKMSQEEIEKLLSATTSAPEPEPAPPVSSGGKMSQEEIEKLLSASTSAPEPEPAPPVSSGGKMSQEEIEKLLSASTSAPEPEPAPPVSSGGKMSQEEIEKLLSASTSAPEPEPAPPVSSGGKMSQEEIEKLLSASTSAPEPKPAPPVSSGGKMSQEEIEKLLSANSPAEPAAPEPAAAPAPAKPASKPAAPSEEDVSYTNIMQVLVEEKAPAYIKKFGLCTCKQCEADVKALTLTNLVPKYVVLSKLDRIPMLTVYEGRFNSTVFAQLTRACKVVMDHPHHNRN